MKKKKLKNVGIWLDQAKAVVVFIDGAAVEVKKIKSDLKQYHKASGGSRKGLPYTPKGGVSQQKEVRKRNQQLQVYYAKILKAVKDTDKLYVFGPSNTKLALKKEYKNTQGSGKIEIETADNLTQRQIIAQVKKHYHALTGHS